MNAPLYYTSVGAAGLIVGILAGGHFAAAPGSAPEPARAVDVRKAMPVPRSAARPAELQKDAHDLASLLDWRRRQEAGDPDLLRELERMDGPALRSLLIGIVSADPKEQQDMQAVLEMAAKELYRREGEPALLWAAGLEPKASSRAILSRLIAAAAYDTPALAKPWIARFRDEHGKDLEGTFLYWAVRGAGSRGADDLVGLGELFGDRIWRSGAPFGPYADDFDFRRLVTGIGDKIWLAETATYWGAKDKESAWTGVKDAIDAGGKGAGYLGCLFFGVAAVEGEGPAAAWAAGKLAELPEALRKDAILSLRGFGRVSGEGVGIVMNALPNESDRVTFAASYIAVGTSGGEEVAALQRLSSESSRVEALASAAAKYQGGMNSGPPGHAEKVRSYFDSTMEQLGFSPEAKARVNATLRSSAEDNGR